MSSRKKHGGATRASSYGDSGGGGECGGAFLFDSGGEDIMTQTRETSEANLPVGRNIQSGKACLKRKRGKNLPRKREIGSNGKTDVPCEKKLKGTEPALILNCSRWGGAIK